MLFFSGVEGGIKFMFCRRRVGRSVVPQLKLLEEICRLQFNLETGSSVSGIDKNKRESKTRRQKLMLNHHLIIVSLLFFFLFFAMKYIKLISFSSGQGVTLTSFSSVPHVIWVIGALNDEASIVIDMPLHGDSWYHARFNRWLRSVSSDETQCRLGNIYYIRIDRKIINEICFSLNSIWCLIILFSSCFITYLL